MEEEKKKIENKKINSINEENIYLETNKADKNVLLLKCPPIVSRSLHTQQININFHTNNNNINFNNNINIDDNNNNVSVSTLAKVTVSIDPLNYEDESKRQVTMELVDTEGGGPKYYSMNEIEKFIPMALFSESSDGKLSVEGKVHKKFDMKPHKGNIEEYWKLCRERTTKYMTKTRQIQVIDNDNGLLMRPLPGMSGPKTSANNDKRKIPVKPSDMKRTRRDRGQMEEIMFKLFERQPNWTLKHLLNETDQPEQFLKDLLRDLCVYNNKGANQGTYELKPEYRKSSMEGLDSV